VRIAVLGLLILLPTESPAQERPGVPPTLQGVEAIKQNYTKSEVLIPMRDGVKLFTAVYAPKDTSKSYPILLQRTPYSVGPYGPEAFRGVVGPSPHFSASGYIVAYQDVRGRYMSEGKFVHTRPMVPHDGKPTSIDESTDAYDTIEWLLKNIPNHNGKVGIWGISYPGFYAACATVDAHPALVAASPQAPVTDWFVGDDWHHNGAFFLPHAFLFMANFEQQPPNPTTATGPGFDPGTPDGYRFFLELGPLRNADARYFHGKVAFWNEMMAHGTYDAFWMSRNIRAHLGDSKPAVMTVGGWFDAENHFGALETYKHIEKSEKEGYNVLVMGPWRHGGWAGGDGATLGNLAFDSNTAEHYRATIEFPFFEHHLKGQEIPLPGEAVVFETGRNRWHTFDAWPPANVIRRPVYLGEHGTLGFEPAATDSDEAFDEYVSDPAHPVPYLDKIRMGMTGDYMTEDQRHAATRPDVLVYRSQPLEDDLTIAGPIEVEFLVSTTGTDCDWVVKLIDEYPENYAGPIPPRGAPPMQGYQMMVRGDVMRGKFRDSLSEPRPFQPGQPTRLRFVLHDSFHTFRAGHRIMVQVQSTWFPLVDRNPQKFVDIYTAGESDFQKATQRVYRSKSRPSRIVLPVVELGSD
jgi:putative CocE/NonD family hydrolase